MREQPAPPSSQAPGVFRRREFLRATGAGLLAASLPVLAQSRAATHLFHDPLTLKHLPGRQHPERPGRVEAVLRALEAAPLRDRIRLVESRPAREEDILLAHTRDYLELVKREVAEGRSQLSTGDTALSPDSLAAALAASGAVIAAVDAVLKGKARNAFCAVRPPGHHASAARGMGFCIFNNIAIGARHALRRHGLNRVLIADWDVHHGNGTQDLFYADGSVLFFDTHQDPWYPGTGKQSETGEGKAKGLIINRPFPAGAGRREILGAFREALVPAADLFRPELVMVSAGFDSRAGDPLGQFTLTDQDFADLTDLMLETAARHAGGRLVSVLEGGYSLEGLASAVSAHVARLAAAG